jgi:diacylglycerol kinase family enzyme
MYYYIVNPAAGRGQIRHLQDKMRGRLDELGIRGEWVKTTGPGDATRMTRQAIATQLGIVQWQQACEALAARRLTPYSLIAAGQKFFLSTLTLGFETDLDKTVDTSQSGLGARVGQFRQSFGHARNFGTLRCRIKVDESFELTCELFTLSISNQKFLNPLAENRLIVAISDRPGHQLKLGRMVWDTLRSRNLAGLEEATTRFLANRVVIETDPPTGIMVDGKVAGRTPIAIRLTDRRVRFITEKVVADFKDAVSAHPR